MKAHYLKLIDYHTWVNRRFLATLLENTVFNNRIFLLFSHVLTAEEVWLCRVKGLDAPVQRLWQVYPNETLPTMLEKNSSEWLDCINSLSDDQLSREVSYQNSKEESFTTRLDDIVTHMVNHGTHHRAQISSLLQHEKVAPPVSDYIVYTRSSELKTVS